MNGRTIGAQVALGILTLVGCGGSGGNTGSPPEPNPTGGYDPPPGDYDPPPSGDNAGTFDPPPGDYDPPGGATTPGGAPGGGSCASLCTALLAEGCTELGADATTCSAACTAGIEDLEPCSDEFFALLACVLRSPSFTCDALEGDVEAGNFTECQPQAVAFANCRDDDGGNGGEGGGPPPGMGPGGRGPGGGMGGRAAGGMGPGGSVGGGMGGAAGFAGT